ncbi:MAG: PIN domain-containing protein, partial [Methanothrix sp.]
YSTNRRAKSYLRGRVIVLAKEISGAGDICRHLCILPIDEDANHWREIMQKYRLLPCDSLIVSTCISNGVKHIATFDRDFLRVDRLNIIDLNK